MPLRNSVAPRLVACDHTSEESTTPSESLQVRTQSGRTLTSPLSQSASRADEVYEPVATYEEPELGDQERQLMELKSLPRYLQLLLDDRWYLSKAITRKPQMIQKLAEHFTTKDRREKLNMLCEASATESTAIDRDEVLPRLIRELSEVHVAMIEGAVEAANERRKSITSVAYKRHRELIATIKHQASLLGVELNLKDFSVD